MEITGILKVKFDTQKVSDRFSKRELVLTTGSNTPYPQHVPMQVTQDKCILLDQFNEGDEVKVQININGREWNGPQGIKYFATIDVWKIEKVSGSIAPVKENASSLDVNKDVQNSSAASEDDLPFLSKFTNSWAVESH